LQLFGYAGNKSEVHPGNDKGAIEAETANKTTTTSSTVSTHAY